MIGKGFRRPRCITLPDHETPLWCGRAGLAPGFGDQSWLVGSPAGPFIAGPPSGGRGRRSPPAGDQIRVARGPLARHRRRGSCAATATATATAAALTCGEGDGGTGVLLRSHEDVPIGRGDAR